MITPFSLDTLSDVTRDFAKWRATRPNKGRIPNYLWDKVLGILDFYPIGEVTKELGLSGSQVLRLLCSLELRNIFCSLLMLMLFS